MPLGERKVSELQGQLRRDRMRRTTIFDAELREVRLVHRAVKTSQCRAWILLCQCRPDVEMWNTIVSTSCVVGGVFPEQPFVVPHRSTNSSDTAQCRYHGEQDDDPQLALQLFAQHADGQTQRDTGRVEVAIGDQRGKGDDVHDWKKTSDEPSEQEKSPRPAPESNHQRAIDQNGNNAGWKSRVSNIIVKLEAPVELELIGSNGLLQIPGERPQRENDVATPGAPLGGG